jgi:xylose isomerase
MQTFGLPEELALDLIGEVRDQASFGIWDLLYKGGDTFGDPTFDELAAEEVIRLLRRAGVRKVSLHDVDVGLCPWKTPIKADRDARVEELIRVLEEESRVNVWMYTPCSFKHPVVRAGSLTSNDPNVRQATLKKVLEAVDRAEQFGATYLTLWLGRDGAEVDAVIDPMTAYKRIAEALTVICAYIRRQGYKVRVTLEPKPNEPRGDIYVSTVGTALAVIGLLHPDDQAMVSVNPELLQHEAMAGLNAFHAMGILAAAGKLAFLHLGGQTPLRYDMDHYFCGGNSDPKASFYVMLGAERYMPGGTLEFDCHPFRCDAGPDSREEFIYANLFMAGAMKRKARGFLALPRVQELLTQHEAMGFGMPTDVSDPAFWAQLAIDDITQLPTVADPKALELDMMVNLWLLGILPAAA